MPAALCAVVAAAVAVAAAAACDTSAQHAALLEFWSATDGDLWSPTWQWAVEDDDHCQWRGVACEDECVTRLIMIEGSSTPTLRGTLPDVWGDLATLRRINLSGLLASRLGGPLPASFAALQDLEILSASNTLLTGSLAVLEALPALELVSLRACEFGGPLPEMAQPSLRVLQLNSNQFTGPVVPGYGSLPLTDLRLDANLLSSTVPPELGALPRTALIDLSSNRRLVGVLPHILADHEGLLIDGTQVTIGCDAGWQYNASAFLCDATCDAGSSTPAASYTEVCAPCGPGSAAPSAGSACELCAAGTFSSGANNLACQQCPPATASDVGDSECLPCGPGLFLPAGGTTCQACPAGMFADGPANTECTLCPVGLAATSPGTPVCEPCGAGRISINDGAGCIGCPKGSSTDGAAVATSCTPCAAGTVAPEAGAPVCEACPPGTTSNAIGTACDPCRAGTSTEGAAGALMCSLCPAGTIAGTGAADCDPCGPGTFAPEAGRDACEPCPAGSSTEGATGAIACIPCPVGAFAPAGNATCSPCAPGSFAATEGLSSCTLCPAGTHQAQSGAATACTACRYPGRCREGNECVSGYTGAGCLFCAEGHFRLGNVCLSCPVFPWPLFILLVLGLVLLRTASKNRLGARQTTVLKILLFYVQMVVVVLALQVEWPSTQSGFVEAMSFASAEIGLPMAECYVSLGWYAGYAGSLAGPLAVILIFWLAMKIVQRRRRRAWAATEDAEQDFVLMGRASNLRRLWLAACAAMHLPLVRILLTAFDCELDADGDLVVAGSDDGTQCSSESHVAIQSLSGVALAVVGLIVPIRLMVFTLWLRRTGRLDKGRVQAAWGPLYEGYRSEYCFLEGVVAMRKVALTLTLVVPGIPVGWRTILLLAQSIGWAAFVLVRRPYVRVRGRILFGLVRRKDVINELDVVVSAVIVLHQGVAGLAIWTNGGTVWLEVGIALVVITVFVLLASLWQTARIGRGFEVAPTGFNQTKARRDQQALYRRYLRAMVRHDFDEAMRLRAEGVRHARQTREFAEWRTDHSKVSVAEAPFLELVIAEATTSRVELEAGVEAANSHDTLIAWLERAMAAGHFDVVKRARERLATMPEAGSSSHTTGTRLPPIASGQGTSTNPGDLTQP